ncbi:nitrilase-related carbon-nitrogen hydrolase, partial [Sinorhizobium meliloti]|uniref:nitrilase-related carbon-nitrogen hydrolase n=1 Tax=Rhizobium meliloti TaxID=382 RepID=UPI0025B06EF6
MLRRRASTSSAFQSCSISFYFCCGHEERWFGAAERIPDGPTVKRAADWAKRYGMVIVAALYEEEAPGVYYNTAAVIDADGSYPGKYRKLHIPDGGWCREKLYFKPGNLGLPVFQTAVGRIGVVICNDRHFPEGYRALALGGAEIVFVPTSTGPAARPTWDLEVKAAAFANGMFVGAVNRVGDENTEMGKYFGTSLFGVLRSSAIEPSSSPLVDVVHGALLLFGIGHLPLPLWGQ